MIINTTNKTIQIENENLGEVVEQLQRMLPDSWKEYRLCTPVPFVPDPYHTPYPYQIPIYREIPYAPYEPNPDPLNPWKITCDTFTVTPCVTYGDPSKFGTLHKTVSGDLLSTILSKSREEIKTS